MATRLPFRGVLCDIDGTLADSEPVHERSFAEACRALDLTLPDGFHDALVGRSDMETHAWLVRTCGLTLPLQAWTERRLAAYLDMVDEVAPHPPALALWRRFEALGLPQGTVSNSDRQVVDANLARIGLGGPGHVSVSRNDVRRGKPHPEPFLRGAALLGLAPSEIAAVEDSATGLRAARSAGLQAYRMPWTILRGGAQGRPFEELQRLAGTG